MEAAEHEEGPAPVEAVAEEVKERCDYEDSDARPGAGEHEGVGAEAAEVLTDDLDRREEAEREPRARENAVAAKDPREGASEGADEVAGAGEEAAKRHGDPGANLSDENVRQLPECVRCEAVEVDSPSGEDGGGFELFQEDGEEDSGTPHDAHDQNIGQEVGRGHGESPAAIEVAHSFHLTRGQRSR